MHASESRRTGTLRLKHLREVTEAKAEEMAAQSPRFERLADPASAPQVVSAFGLFPTPPALARRVVELAGITPGMDVLEPSAGTGRLVDAARAVSSDIAPVAVEIDAGVVSALRAGRPWLFARQADFLAISPDAWPYPTAPARFDRIVMNPPFAPAAADVKHVLHAVNFLKPGGRLVSVVMNGPRQRAALKPIATAWHDLPAGSFRASGTNVETAVVVIDRPV